MSSLATQLAQQSSLNASLLVDRSRRKPTLSYLFTGREADHYDLESIHALGVNSFLHLSSLNPTLEKHEDALFSDRAKNTDRTLLPRKAIEELNRSIENLLWLLSPYLMEPPAGKIIEWLVRRFRIHEFNVEAILTLFLPYHESPHFAKMVTILQIKPNSAWSFLIPYKTAAQNLPRVSLVTEMLKNTDVARFVASLLPTAIKKGLAHHVLVTFNAATLHDFIKRSRSLDEGTTAYLVSFLLKPLQQKPKKHSKDAVLGSYILLASLSQKCNFSEAALKVILFAIASSAHVVQGDQLVNSLIAICGPQPELENFTDGTIEAMLSIPGIKEVLAKGSTWTDSEKVLRPLVRGLSAHLEDSASIELIESIIATRSIPLSVIEVMAVKLLKACINSEVNSTTMMTARRLVAQIQQRQPELLEKIVEFCGEEDKLLKEALEHLSITLSTVEQVSSGSEEGSSIILASTNADSKVRTAAVKELVSSIAGKSLSDITNLESIRTMLIDRLQDTNATILETLYSQSSVITPIYISDTKAYLSSLSLAIDSQSKTKRSILRLHLQYLVSSFWSSVEPSIQDEVFHQVLFPFLLFSKPRQKTAEVVWDLLDEHILKPSEDCSIEWLKGCITFVKTQTPEAGDFSEAMNEINNNVAEKIAYNILNSPRSSKHIDTLIKKLQDSRSHVKLLGYLIATALIKKSSEIIQIETAQKLMDAMCLKEISGIDDQSQEHLALLSENNRSLSKYIISKPNSQTTLNWLQIVLIATILRIPKPSGIALDWLAESAQAHSYIRLTRSLYNLANVSKSVPVLATTLLEILFSTLQSDALAFLAGIWTAGSNDSQSFASLALLHAAAFLEAHILEDDGIDFQTILPALLVALHNSDSSISHGAIECVSRIRLISEHNLVSVYKFDKIYGKNKDALQYLNREDLKRYLSAIVEHRDHFKNDPSYLKILHEQHLSRNKADKKRDTDYKHRVVCYILSHINALSSETAQNSLLKSISTVTDKAKSEMLLSTIQLAVEKASLVDASPTPSSTLEELTSRLLSCYDAVSAVHLNESDVAWDVFVKVTTTYFRADTLLSFQEALAHGIEAGLFTSLNQQRKTALCDILLEVGSQNQSGLSLARRVLSTILVDVPLIIRLLESYSPSGPTSSPRVSKRAKTTESPEDTLPRLSLLAEILGSGSLPGSLDLVSHLLDTLSKIIQTLPQVQPDVSYIEQLLMSAIESSASKITEVPNISPSVIRLDVLVEVIRVSNNPQTFHQALLLISNLARLAPESVLYNVMPIFTFMGSNVFHRDDSYSFKVVQQTINAIVPVMASSLKKAHASSLDLFLKSKEFLCVFSDAANHIPRHRRNNFFAHLIDALGPRDFLAPMCMLLTEKTANRVVRQTSDEIQNSLTLPISLLQHSSYSLQLHTATQILEESKRMIEHIINPDSTHPIFLEATVNGDHSISSSTILRRRAQALIIFIGYSLKPMNFQASEIEDTLSISSVIAQLITLATLHDGTMKETNLQEVSEAARSTLGKLLNGMSVVDFIEAVKIMLQSSDAKVQSGALELLAKRLPDVSDKTRTAISSSITKILLSIKEISSVQKDSSTLTYALQAIKSISSTLSPGEEGALTDVVPFVLSVSKEKSLALPALGALSSMSIKLGPRIIPFFRSIISQCVSLLRGSNLELFDEALSVLHGLLVTIPTFWGSNEITQVIFLHIDQASLASKLPSSASSSLMKALSKRTLSNVLISTLVEIWQSLKSSTNLSKTSAYFDVYARAVQYANRPTVMEYLRVSFKNFLEAFDVVKVDVEAEFRVISAFKELVVKLNETAFKPLFRRLHDWAFVEKIDDISRKVTFGHLYIALLDFFKGLMVPYISFLLQPYSDTLTAFTNSSIRDFDLWSTILETLTKALSFDDGGYWRDDKLRQIAKPLTDQIDVCVRLKFTDGNGQAILQDCFNALIEFATDDNLLKSINLSILMHTRSEDARVRILALSCSEAIWRTNGGGKLLGFVSETATFIAECSEDENDLVIKECFKLKDTVENVAGKIDGL